MWLCPRLRLQCRGWWAFPGAAIACRRFLLTNVGRVPRVWVGCGASRKGCVWQASPSKRGWRRGIKWVLRGGRGVKTDFEVRVRFPSVVVEVLGLRGQSRAGGRSKREARRDKCGPVVQ